MGGVSGVIAKTVNAPLERVKILLQTQQADGGGHGGGHAPVDKLGRPVAPYKGIMDCIRRVPIEQGFLSFWRGNFANCLRYFPTQAMNFAFKDKYQKMFVRPREEVGFALFFAGYLAAGGAAGATALTVSYPLEYTFTRLAADKGAVKKYTGIVDCITKTVKSDGISGIYRGYMPSVAGIIIYRAGYFGLYDYATKEVLPSLGVKQAQQHTVQMVAVKFSLALCVDVFAALCAYPLDTVRRALMMQSGKPKEQVLYRTSAAAFKYIMKQDGFGGLYKGALMNAVRAVGSALVLVLYDEIKYFYFGAAAGGGKH